MQKRLIIDIQKTTNGYILKTKEPSLILMKTLVYSFETEEKLMTFINNKIRQNDTKTQTNKSQDNTQNLKRTKPDRKG